MASPEPSRKPEMAMVEDMDEDGNVVEGTYHYARSNRVPGSPTKQQPNTGRKKSLTRGDSTSPNFPNDSDSTAHPLPSRSSKSKPKQPERRPSTSKKTVVVDAPQKRPSARPAKTMPTPLSRDSDEASYYGIPHQTVMASRSRASTRPASYYGQPHNRPPLSHSAYYPPTPPQPLPQASYPPNSWAASPHLGHMMAPSPMPACPPVDYFGGTTDNLAARFGGRPQSSMGFHANPYDGHEPERLERTASRRMSVSRRSTDQEDCAMEQRAREDRARMPPPHIRPSSARPERLGFRQPPRKHVGFDDDDLDGESELYKHAYHSPSFEYGTDAIPPKPSKRASYGATTGGVEYDYGGYSVEPSSHNRRNSSYGIEEKIRTATQYQNDVGGGPTALLTAASLRAAKNGGSSRSTRSSASRDESSYKQSATTQTTRSGSDDDITIKVPQGAVVEVGNTKISCGMGGEVTIPRSSGGSRAGSDRATTVFGDDRKSRAERPTGRHRTDSQSGSYSRALHPGAYAHAHAPQHYAAYGHAQGYIPPPPAYPQNPHDPPAESYAPRYGHSYGHGDPF